MGVMLALGGYRDTGLEWADYIECLREKLPQIPKI